jgi:hypothetical protein
MRNPNNILLLICLITIVLFSTECQNHRKLPTIDSDNYINDSLAENYWNNFKFSDSTIRAVDVESSFASYARLLYGLPYKDAIKAEFRLIKVLNESCTSVYKVFMDMAEKYFYNPQSGLCDDELYRPFLKNAVNNKKLDYATRERLQYRLEINGRNRPGDQAIDFIYETIDGKNSSLYGIRSKYVLVYFNNPDCHDCKIVCEELKRNSQISRLVSNNILKILSVYPDRDKRMWIKNAKSIPVNWINAIDSTGNIKDDNIYDLKAIPTLYLLDVNKRVVLKDASFKKLINFMLHIA